MIAKAFDEAQRKTGIHATLTMKCANPFNPDWQREFEKIVNSKIYLIVGNNNMKELYQEHDFGLYASRGEAWNLPLIESIACGLPTITTACTGQSEYLNDYPEPLIIRAGTKELADDGLFFKGDKGNWIIPDYESMVITTSYVLLNPERVYREYRQLCIDAVKPYTWEAAAKKLINL
jgi:glycosyltransferase involved in cell wall biosynthesis